MYTANYDLYQTEISDISIEGLANDKVAKYTLSCWSDQGSCWRPCCSPYPGPAGGPAVASPPRSCWKYCCTHSPRSWLEPSISLPSGVPAWYSLAYSLSVPPSPLWWPGSVFWYSYPPSAILVPRFCAPLNLSLSPEWPRAQLRSRMVILNYQPFCF